MKINFIKILIVCFLTNHLFGQQVTNTEFKTKTLEIFKDLDKERVPHGILLDFGMEFTNIQKFDGKLSDSVYSSSQSVSDCYKTLLMSRVRTVETGFIAPEEYTNRWFRQRTTGIIVLSGQFFKYSQFEKNAYPDRLNYDKDHFSDKFVENEWQNPYEEKELFTIAPPINSYKGFNFQVKLPQDLFLSNYPDELQSIEIDFSDGNGFRTVRYDELIEVAYTSEAVYDWIYKITLVGGKTLLSHSKIAIEAGLQTIEFGHENEPRSESLSNATSVFSRIRINAITPFNSIINTGATIYIRYANGGNTIRKPLIIAEGFDSGIITNPEQEAGDTDIDDFIESTEFSQSLSFNLENQINSYDIIYVDWNNGVDFLQRNAYVLHEVIKWVNAQKLRNGSTEQNIVIGQSMGGLIARYALKTMENMSINHDTKLYVSHDAPHLGANTPISAQLSARHLRNTYVNAPILALFGEVIIPMFYDFASGFSQIINFFGGDTSVGTFVTPLQLFSISDTAATRQMSYNWVNHMYGIDNRVHDAWQSDLTQKGYPVGFPQQGKPIRNIAISNGSECGTTQIDNGTILSYSSDSGTGTGWPNLLDALLGIVLNNPIITIVALLPGGDGTWISDFKCRSMSTLNQNKELYYGYIGYKKKILYLFNSTTAVTELSINQPYGVLPYDIYGGGNFRTATNQFPIDGIVSNSFGFIPTASSLDIGLGNTTINDEQYRKSYVGGLPPIAPTNSPFHNFVTGFEINNPNASNSRHISFNRRNGDWLALELIGTTPTTTNCSFVCTNLSITGNEVICNSQTYSVPSGASFYNWSVGQGAYLVSISSNGTRNFTVTPLPSASGFVTITLTMGDDQTQSGNTPCGNLTLTKTIWVGVPLFNSIEAIGNHSPGYNPSEPSFSVGDGEGGCNQIRFKFNFNSPSILEYQWEKLASAVTIPTSTLTGELNLYPQCNERLELRVRTRNSCGWSEWKNFEHYMNRCTNNCIVPGPTPLIGDNFILNPNPLTDGLLNISIKHNAPWFYVIIPGGLTDENGLPVRTLIQRIRVNISIFNQSGMMVQSFNNSPMPIQLNLSNLPQGTYVVVLEHQGNMESYTIIKN